MSQTLGTDRSGNNNNWTVNNITISDQMVDSPTNNFCTLNPIDNYGAKPLSEGNLKCSGSVSTCFNSTTFWVETGKWYFESLVTAIGSGSGDGFRIGFTNDVCRSGVTSSSNIAWTLAYLSDGKAWDGATELFGAASYGATDIVAMAIDLDAGTPTLKMYKNNVLQITRNISAAFQDVPLSPFMGDGEAGTIGGVMNFGQDSSFAGNKTAQGNQDGNDIGDFYYTPPTGYLALCTSNLPAVAVIPSEHFNTAVYAGSGSSSSRDISVGFQPDWTWLKSRSSADNNMLLDSVRGRAYFLKSNSTAYDLATPATFNSWNSDGFTLTGTSSAFNASGNNYVAWNWKANGSGSSNTDGSINTTATSANVDAGFSISTYTGTGVNGTIGHGLSKAPEMVIVKERGDDTGNWYVWHTGFAATDGIFLNLVNAKATSDTYWNDTAPTADVFSVGTNTDINGNTGTDTYVAYCFHSVDGYSKVGSYTGNGSTDGTFVYTGFRPAYILWKTVSDSGWKVVDNKRDGFNGDNSNDQLIPNTSQAETDAGRIDLVSNGFKVKTSSGGQNENGTSYIYIAFAETPFKFSNAR
jgi:hypothetical protein